MSDAIGQEVEFRIRPSPSGVAVDVRDGRGLGPGMFTKSRTRYFYGDDAAEKARRYADNAAARVGATAQVTDRAGGFADC